MFCQFKRYLGCFNLHISCSSMYVNCTYNGQFSQPEMLVRKLEAWSVTKILLRMVRYVGSSIEDIGNWEGEGVKYWSKKSRRIIMCKKVPIWGRGVSKVRQNLPTSFMDGPCSKVSHISYSRMSWALNQGWSQHNDKKIKIKTLTLD